MLSVARCELQLLRAMYPDSGYSSETGGIMENLRTSTNNTKVNVLSQVTIQFFFISCFHYYYLLQYKLQVRDFHKKFYRPENLTIILTGQIEAEDVFKALSVVEDDIIAKVHFY